MTHVLRIALLQQAVQQQQPMRQQKVCCRRRTRRRRRSRGKKRRKEGELECNMRWPPHGLILMVEIFLSSINIWAPLRVAVLF